MKKYTLAVLGCGNMAQAIIRALYEEKTQKEFTDGGMELNVTVSDIDENKMSALNASVTKTADNAFAVKNADYVLLAVKPQSAAELLKNLDVKDKVIISIMAGTSIDTLNKLTHSNKIVRVMPNLNARVFMSYNAYACRNISSSEKLFTEKLLGSFGRPCEVAEDKLDAVTGLTGSSPAFVFMLIKSFIDKGISLGFTPDTAREMALTAIIGSAKLVESSRNIDLNTLIDSVCSKGGTTIEGVNYLREKQFETIAGTAIEKAVNRAKELGSGK